VKLTSRSLKNYSDIMNCIKIPTILTAILTIGCTSAQTATSDIVGYETVSLTTGFNALGARLVQPTVLAGTFDGDNNTELTDSSADFSTLTANTPYVLQITDSDGFNEVFITLDLSDSTSITTQIAALGDFSSASYTIRPAETIASLFGTNNSAGLTSTTDPTTSDQIWVSDDNGGFTEYFFFDLNGVPTLSLTEPLGPIDPSTVTLNSGFLVVANGGAKTVTQAAPSVISNL